jgi:cytochrome b561
VTRQYTAVAIVLHWAIAAAIVANLLLGWWMHHAIDEAATQARAITAYQLHKSLGLTVLVLSVARLLWRWRHAPPPLPATMARWERVGARALHWAFYGLMIAVPFSGWLYASTQWRHDAPLTVPTLWFGLIRVPHLFGLDQAPRDVRRALAGDTLEAHEWLAWSMGGLLVLHMAAALKHHFVNRDDVLESMAPGVRPGPAVAPAAGEPWRRTILATGFAAMVLATLAIVAVLFASPRASVGAGQAEVGTAAGSWVVDPTASEIAFAGAQSGEPFRGRFTRWQADIRLDPAAPEQARIDATVQTGSATDGVPLHDETLAQAEWFDVANHPQATFHATRIAPRTGSVYDIAGTLTIKDRAIELPPLTLTVAGNELRITGQVEIDRTAANLGMESDPGAEYVSRKIVVEVDVRARAP